MITISDINVVHNLLETLVSLNLATPEERVAIRSRLIDRATGQRHP